MEFEEELDLLLPTHTSSRKRVSRFPRTYYAYRTLRRVARIVRRRGVAPLCQAVWAALRGAAMLVRWAGANALHLISRFVCCCCSGKRRRRRTATVAMREMATQTSYTLV